MNRIPFTKEGLTKLQSEHEELVKKRPAAVADLKSAREKGDLSENSAYRAAKSKLGSIDNRMRRLKAILDKAFIVENRSIEYVDIGTFVTIVDENKEEQKFRIVNTFESDLSNNQISSFSPLGKAMMGRKLNDKISVKTPNGVRVFTITRLALGP